MSESAFRTLIDDIKYLIQLIRVIGHRIIRLNHWMYFPYHSLLETSKTRSLSFMDVHAVEKTLMNFVEFDKVPGKKSCTSRKLHVENHCQSVWKCRENLLKKTYMMFTQGMVFAFFVSGDDLRHFLVFSSQFTQMQSNRNRTCDAILSGSISALHSDSCFLRLL